MICSVELPVKYLDFCTHFDFDFVIASTCKTHPAYLDYFLNAPRRFMILDNGAFETGAAMPDDEYISLARQLRPDVLVIPDVYKNNVATGTRAVAFLDSWHRDSIPGVSLMGVLQGDHPRILDAMIDTIYKEVPWIALPYATEIDRFQYLIKRPHIQNVHILGLPSVMEAVTLRDIPAVKSIDSSLPVKLAVTGKSIRNTFFANQYATPDTIDLDEILLRANLRVFTSMCNSGLLL